MGIKFTDQFSLLHFASGIIAYFWKFSFTQWFIFHLLYEIITNTKFGIYIINNYTQWPGGKLDFDNILNSTGDQFWGMLGWVFAHLFILYFYKGSMVDEYEDRKEDN